jgi:hypothetical protein
MNYIVVGWNYIGFFAQYEEAYQMVGELLDSGIPSQVFNYWGLMYANKA